MRKAHVDPFLISSAALSAPSPFKLCGQVKGQAVLIQFLACKNILLLVCTNEECICITTVDSLLYLLIFLETVDLCKTNYKVVCFI